MTQEAGGRVLPLAIDSPGTLQAMWMPFVLSGALFLPDVTDAELEQKFFLLLSLPGVQERIAVSGQVVWINPAATVMRQGIGVRLLESDGAARTAIGNCLKDVPPASEAFYCQAKP